MNQASQTLDLLDITTNKQFEHSTKADTNKKGKLTQMPFSNLKTKKQI